MLKLLLSALLVSSSFSTPISPRTSSPPITNVYTFPPKVFVENIAVRSNSNLLLTSMSTLSLYSINPLTSVPFPTILHTFSNDTATGLIGITETTPDIFAVTTGIIDLAATRVTPGSLIVWTVNLKGATPVVRRVVTVLNTTILNGLTTVPGAPHLLLAADSAAGAVYKINILTGAYSISFSSPLFEPVSTTPGTNLGINGLQAKGTYLYFTNSAQDIYGRVPITLNGAQNGPVEIISSPQSPELTYDDVAIENQGGAWIATHPANVVKVESDGSQRTWNSSLLLNPTSAAFGRGSVGERKRLYVTNGGRFDENFVLVEGGVVSVDTRGF